MKFLFSALAVITIFLTGCSGSSSEIGSAASGITPEQRQNVPTRTVAPAGQRKEGQYVFVWQKFVIPPYIEPHVSADCPQDYVVLSGGYDLESGSLQVTATKPNSAFDGWIVAGPRNHSDYIKVTVYATCATVK